MKLFKLLLLFTVLSNSLSLFAMDRMYELFHLKQEKPRVKSQGAISLLKLSAIEKECDDAEYFQNNYGELKVELGKYRAEWDIRKDAIMPRLGLFGIGSLQLFLGSICFHEMFRILIGEQEIVEHRMKFYCAILGSVGVHQWQKSYKNFKELWNWTSVSHKKISAAGNALIKLKKYKEAPVLR